MGEMTTNKLDYGFQVSRISLLPVHIPGKQNWVAWVEVEVVKIHQLLIVLP